MKKVIGKIGGLGAIGLLALMLGLFSLAVTGGVVYVLVVIAKRAWEGG